MSPNFHWRQAFHPLPLPNLPHLLMWTYLNITFLVLVLTTLLANRLMHGQRQRRDREGMGERWWSEAKLGPNSDNLCLASGQLTL